MKFHISINKVTTVDEIKSYWKTGDYLELLDRFGLPNAEKAADEELRELLFMAISDFEPNEAAAILLDYKLSEQLNEGQISQISHDMLVDKIAEEYPDISLHAPLFHINQLLYKAYNGKFPAVKASVIDLTIKPAGGHDLPITKETIIKAFGDGLSERSVIKRLFVEQLNGEVEFPEAESIIWELLPLKENEYRIITSDYWINDEDFIATEFEGEVVEVEEHKDH